MGIRIAQVGLGYWGPNLLRNLAGIEDFEVVAVCDLDQDKLKKMSQRHCPGAKQYTDFKAMLDEVQLDALAVATPIRSHFALASAALKAGLHTFVEKPLASTVEECRILNELADAKKLTLMVGHVFEYNNAVRKIKEIISSGQLGNIFYLYSQRVNLGRIQNDINALWSFAPHDISIINYWTGLEPRAVTARGFSYLTRDVEDVIFMVVEYPDNINAHLHLGWLDPRKIRTMTVVGSRQMLVYDDVSLDAKIKIYDKGVKGLHEYVHAPETFAEFQFQIKQGDLVIPALKFGEPLATECKHFADCLQSGSRPISDGRNGMRVVKVLEAANASLARQGARIEID